MNLSAFKAYDLRGRIPDEINDDLARAVGRAYAGFVKPKRVVVGRDIRLTSTTLADALIEGLLESGVSVADIGLCGTEGVYFSTSHSATTAGGFDGGIMVTASHNPPDYNGMKFVREGSRPISSDTGLRDMALMIREGRLPAPAATLGGTRGVRSTLDTRAEYIGHLLGYVDRAVLRKLKIVVNAGNGGAGAFVDLLEPYLPFEFVKIHHEPDGNFPNGVPNPMLEANRVSTVDAIRRSGADLGLAWDSDFDRCFFFDHTGRFIEGYYLVGLLAQGFLQKEPGARIVHDPRLTWNTLDIVRSAGGEPVLCKSGHAFIKQKMREVDATYGGEMSAHHYFRDFAYCDSGMIPWLLVTERICQSGKTLAELVDERIAMFPCSGEINRKVPDGRAAINAVQGQYVSDAKTIDYTDGLSMEFADWRLNLRSSNTEPLIRLNVESRGSDALMREKTEQVLGFLRDLGAEDPGH
ncbi:MAG: phosphomannomutase [Gammaproteobacteria bacterium]|nr:phosphomannomutase [Gammaproteobacteria bacterium]